MKTNANATTAVPTHTMGLAFDIGLVNATPRQAYEIRDVLRKMRDAGDILFIGERQQLVFHVVPHPSRLGYFTDVYTRALGAPGAANGTPVDGFPIPGAPVELLPSVDTDVISVLPAPEVATEWWATDDTQSDLALEVTPSSVRALSPARVTAAETRDVSLAPLIALLAGGLTLVPVYRRSRDQEYSIKSLLTS